MRPSGTATAHISPVGPTLSCVGQHALGDTVAGVLPTSVIFHPFMYADNIRADSLSDDSKR
eukprot:3756308-Karenia_brevis.AAC.1